ncbi:MAG: Fic family protein [Deltaproteobacteria bacterium]|nr:Fic family protein [Deltaproteobacteria bacterium]
MKPYVLQKLPLKEVNWELLIPLIGKANRAIAYYDGVLNGVPDPAILLSPLTTQEGVLSSKMEGTQATLGEVLKFEAGEEQKQESKKLDINEILNYRKALYHAEEELKTRPFSLNLLKELHDILLDSVRGRDKGRGQFRTTQNYIGRLGTPIEQADFVPPDPMFLIEHLDNWEKYYHADRPDPLVQLAIVHAQFEIIHPFNDGNGRLGRILVPIFLYEKKLLSRPMFYLSGYFEEHRDEYISRLRAIGKEDDAWDQWIRFFLKAIDEQSHANADKAQSIMALYKGLKARVIELTHSRYAVPILDQMFERPIFTSAQLVFSSDAKPGRATITNFFRPLIKAGILDVAMEGSGRRPRILVLSELMDICESKKTPLR